MRNRMMGVAAMAVLAVVLVIGHAVPSGAEAVVADRTGNYQMATAEDIRGGDSLYVVDNRSGVIAVLRWNPKSRQMEVQAVRPLQAAFE